jgi:hypothetical protein
MLHCQSGKASCFLSVAEQGFPQTGQGRLRCGRFLLLCSFGGIHRPAGKLSGVPKPPEIGGCIGFHAKQFVLWSRHVRRPRYLLCHPLRIILQKGDLIQGKMEQRVMQLAFESWLIGGG